MFYNDQAIALRIAHDILHGDMRTVGLASSSGAANPPLYVYIVAVFVAIHDGVLFATASVAVLSVVAVALAYFVVRPRFGGTVAVVTIALFATAPIGVVLLGSWLAHNAKHGFHDFSLILNNGRGHGGTAGTGTIEAARRTIDLVSTEGWSFITGAHHQTGAAWTLGRAAGIVVIVLLVVGIVTSLARIIRDGRHPEIDTARRALLLIWLVGISLAYITSSRSGVGPHYVIVSYPVSFLLAALGFETAASLVRRRSAVISLTTAAAIAAAFVAFTLSFRAFVRQHDGTAGA